MNPRFVVLSLSLSLCCSLSLFLPPYWLLNCKVKWYIKQPVRGMVTYASRVVVVFQRMPHNTARSECLRMLTYDDVCLRMLTYADVC